MTRIIGHLDRCDEAFIAGWVMIPDANEIKLRLEFLLDEKVIGRSLADQFRQDLKDANLGDGHCAFSFPTPAYISIHEINRIIIRLENSSVILPVDAASPNATLKTATRETVSSFGGLWIDHDDWLDRLATKHRKGEVSEDLCAAIFRFVRDGYLAVKGAVASEVVDRVNADVDRVWFASRRPDG
jgi:hypothetical protein